MARELFTKFITFAQCLKEEFVNCQFKSEGPCQNPRHQPNRRR